MVCLEEDILTTYKMFCHDSSERVLKDVTNCVGTIHEEVGKTIQGIDYGCFIKAKGSTFTIDLSTFFSSKLAMEVALKALPWEKDPSQQMAVSLFEEYSNMMISGLREYSIEVSGNFSLHNSSIIGAKISSIGDINAFSSNFLRSGPILLNGNNASISLMEGSIFTGSLDDHDIRAMPESNIHWSSDTIGSGDLTDKWERRIKGQYLQFDAVWVEYQIKGLYGVPTYTNFSGNDGKSYIDGGRERIIEIGWSDDNIWATEDTWEEDAIINVIKYRTAWNPENSEIENYGASGIKLTNDKITIIDQNTPDIKWLSLKAEGDENDAKGSVVMVGEVANEGTAAAHFAISCYLNSTGESAETNNYPDALVEAGEVGEIVFDWRNSKSGTEELKCIILTPMQIVDEYAFGGGNITSETVNWQIDEEDEGLSYVIPIIIVMIMGVISIGYVLVNRANLDQETIVEDVVR